MESTKQQLAKAFEEVLKSKSLDKVTITDITDLCGLNRQTFYYHFSDVNDLIEWIFTCHLESITEMSPNDEWADKFRAVFQFMQCKAKMVERIYYSRSREILGDILLRLSRRTLTTILDERYAQTIEKNDRRMITEFYSYAIVGTMLDWIKAGMMDNYLNIVVRIQIMVHHGLTAVARYAAN
ncbi:MAG: TetR/AcrR family transcriptional regulator C-terminal domain-containing protein [Solobacterium sp.]|nr:TetR/AcrR family transcriptional regulator C-terminal domain-containing protein [Solobacterium sp.]